MRKTLLFAATAGVLCANVAFGAIGQANPGQQGSLLIFPQIVVHDGNATIVRIANNSERAVRLKCYWVNQGVTNVEEQFADYTGAVKELRDFAFDLTRNQSVWFNARDGFGSVSVSPFPDIGVDGSPVNGELICFATNATEFAEIPHNFLSGTAEIVDTETGDTQKYSAYSFFLNASPEIMDGELELNFDLANLANSRYDACSEFMVANFTPNGAAVDIDGSSVVTSRNTLHWAGCDQDLEFETGKARFIEYEVTFEVWNSDEFKRTGAFELGDSVWEVDLGNLDRNGLYFTLPGLGTNTGYFRARENSGRGMLGTLTTAISVNGGAATAHTTTTHGAGRAIGGIMYEPGLPFPEAPAEE